MAYTAMASNGGGVIHVGVLLVGRTRSANRPENRHGLIDGLLRDTLRDSLLSRAVIVLRNYIEL